MTRRLLAATLVVVALLQATPAIAYWAADVSSAGLGAAIATTVDGAGAPTASVGTSAVALTWPAGSLANGQPVTGYQVERYRSSPLALDAVGAGCSGTLTTTSCTESAVPDGVWRYTVTPVVGSSWKGAESPASNAVTADSTAPTNGLALSAVTGGAHLSGATVYFRGVAAGSVRVDNAVADATSGPVSSATAALGGISTGWTHTPSVVSTPAGGPYQSAVFSWVAGTTSAPTVDVTGSDVSGNTEVSGLSFVNDSTAPATGSVSYANGYTPSPSVTFTAGTDLGSGLGTGQLQRSSAALVNGSCATFGGFVDLGAADPVSPYVDQTVVVNNCYRYQYLVKDNVGNQGVTTSPSVAKVRDYGSAVLATSGLVSFWRLGEKRTPSTTTSDSFTGTTGSGVQSRAGETGATWTRHPSSDADGVLTSSGRVRKAGVSSRGSLYYCSGLPADRDYSVSADVHLSSVVVDDAIGVVGRMDSATPSGDRYVAGWESSPGRWVLYAYVNGAPTLLGSSTGRPLTPGTSARLELDMEGTTLRVLVDDVQLIGTNDNRISVVGRAGFMLGGANAAPTTVTDTTGTSLDDVAVTAGSSGAIDSFGSSSGEYVNGTALAGTGALGVDPNKASSFDGVDDHVQTTRTTPLPVGASPRSVELWIKTTTSARQVLFAYGSLAAPGQEFGLWLDPGATSLTAWGNGAAHPPVSRGDLTFPLGAALNDGAWHHVVKTYDGTDITIYVDGVALAPKRASRDTVIDGYGFTIGAALNPADPLSQGGYFDGLIDEVSLYSTALAPSDVTLHHQRGTAQ